MSRIVNRVVYLLGATLAIAGIFAALVLSATLENQPAEPANIATSAANQAVVVDVVHQIIKFVTPS